MNNYAEYYKDQLTDAQEFQDFVAEKLYQIGLPLFNYTSKKYQYEHGENKLGVEIKFDKKFQATGNLWIELAEKSSPAKVSYINSGIQRNDNTWLYLIGNYQTIFIFAKSLLFQLSRMEKYKIIENNHKTSRGFLLPEKDAQKYAAKVLEF